MKDMILNAAKDSVADFLYYDRKEDEDLPKGAIEEAIKNGEITADDIIWCFRKELESGLNVFNRPPDSELDEDGCDACGDITKTGRHTSLIDFTY